MPSQATATKCIGAHGLMTMVIRPVYSNIGFSLATSLLLRQVYQNMA